VTSGQKTRDPLTLVVIQMNPCWASGLKSRSSPVCESAARAVLATSAVETVIKDSMPERVKFELSRDFLDRQ
jgi:hypothetical protein